jgi:3D (Asp-Asp-Asp) domain-containing protein
MLSCSLKQKIVVTCGAMLGFCLLHEAITLDSRDAARQAALGESAVLPASAPRLRFHATAYCRGQTTAAGTAARRGIAAADPDLLPVGSVVQIDSLGPKYSGIYTVMDTGPSVIGRHIDIYMWNCDEAVQFGRRPVEVGVVRLGWNPQASAARAGALFKRKEQEAQARERPLPPSPVPERTSTPAPAPGPATQDSVSSSPKS